MKKINILSILYFTTLCFACSQNKIKRKTSTSMIEKFIHIYKSLKQGKESMEIQREIAIRKVKQKIEEVQKSDRSYNMVIIVSNRIDEVVKETEKVCRSIDRVINELVYTAGGGSDELYVVKNPSEIEKVESIMVTRHKLGNTLQNMLERHIDWLNRKKIEWKLPDPKFDYIALDNKDNPMYKQEQSIQNKTFAENNFIDTPIIIAITVLLQKQMALLDYEQIILSRLGVIY